MGSDRAQPAAQRSGPGQNSRNEVRLHKPPEHRRPPHAFKGILLCGPALRISGFGFLDFNSFPAVIQHAAETCQILGREPVALHQRQQATGRPRRRRVPPRHP